MINGVSSCLPCKRVRRIATACVTGGVCGVLGRGLVADGTIHPATRAMVDAYVAWYDRHADPAWQDVVLTPPDAAGGRTPTSFIVPRTAQDLVRLGRCFSATTFPTAGNIT